MKKIIISIIVVLISTGVRGTAVSGDMVSFSNNHGKNHFFDDLSISFIWFEAEALYPIKESHLKSLPSGMSQLLYNSKGGFSADFFGLSFYYKNRYGIELMLLDYSEIGSDESSFVNYLTDKYPNNYVDDNYWGAGYVSGGLLAYRLCYRHPLKYFQITGKLQLGINNIEVYNELKTFKEKGTNQFIEYSIEKENLKRTTIDYHFIVDLSKQFNIGIPIELGLKSEFTLIPSLYEYTISETPYGKASLINTMTLKQNHPSWGIGIVVRLMIKTRDNR